MTVAATTANSRIFNGLFILVVSFQIENSSRSY
jgi:hypothetical protein